MDGRLVCKTKSCGFESRQHLEVRNLDHHGPMVKRISHLASNEAFQVRILVGLFYFNAEAWHWQFMCRDCVMLYPRKSNPIGDGVRLESV